MEANKYRHHYVWKKYLEPWTNDGKLWCLREGKIFNPNTDNIAHEKGFYKLREVSDAALKFLIDFASSSGSEDSKRVQNGWIQMLTVVFEYKRQAISIGIDDDEFWIEIDRLINNTQENLHMGIETAVAELVQRLLEGDTSFYEQDELCMEFINYLAFQQLRTKKVAKPDKVIRSEARRRRSW